MGIDVISRGGIPFDASGKMSVLGGGGFGFSTAPVSFFNAIETYISAIGDNRAQGCIFIPTGGAAGALKYGDSFASLQQSYMTERPSWHEDEPSAASGGPDGTAAFEIAMTQVLQEPGDVVAAWPSSATTFAASLGTYFAMGSAPLIWLPTLTGDLTGTDRIIEVVFKIRRIAGAVDMAERNLLFHFRKD